MKKASIYSLLLFLFTFCVTFTGCQSSDSVDVTLENAQNLMDEKPDSVLKLLCRITSDELRIDVQRARYALLYSQALDKNYIDTTEFDALQPAIDYYLEHGTPDEKLRTLYYQGRIYQNRGDDDMAMETFLKATDIEGAITDSLLYAHLLVARGVLCYNQYQITNYVADNLLAAEIYGSIGKRQLEIKSYANVLNGEIILQHKERADSIIAICQRLMEYCPDGDQYIYGSPEKTCV